MLHKRANLAPDLPRQYRKCHPVASALYIKGVNYTPGKRTKPFDAVVLRQPVAQVV